MRTFSSYGPVDRDLHYHAPRTELIKKAYVQLAGEIPEKGGHYITVWAPRQTGKTWIMQQVVKKIRELGDFEVGILILQSAKTETEDAGILEYFANKLKSWFGRKFPAINSWKKLAEFFTEEHFEKPLILILDEFDALREDFINKFANGFREMYIGRQNAPGMLSEQKRCMLNGLALIGVRSVLGIENVSGSPFNVQRSLHIPNLIFDEVKEMFAWYERESGQKVEQEVTERLFYETRGQTGLTCWLGELLTETYNEDKGSPITAKHFDDVFRMAVHALPNSNILSIISKVKQEPYKSAVMDIFNTDEKTGFRYSNPMQNYLYMNGVTDIDKTPENLYLRFSSHFVQKSLFDYFSDDLFSYMGKTLEPFADLSDTVTETSLNIRNLMRRFEIHLKKNREWLLRDAPRRKDLRIFEAVFHFALYRWLCDFSGNETRAGLA